MLGWFKINIINHINKIKIWKYDLHRYIKKDTWQNITSFNVKKTQTSNREELVPPDKDLKKKKKTHRTQH